MNGDAHSQYFMYPRPDAVPGQSAVNFRRLRVRAASRRAARGTLTVTRCPTQLSTLKRYADHHGIGVREDLTAQELAAVVARWGGAAVRPPVPPLADGPVWSGTPNFGCTRVPLARLRTHRHFETQYDVLEEDVLLNFCKTVRASAAPSLLARAISLMLRWGSADAQLQASTQAPTAVATRAATRSRRERRRKRRRGEDDFVDDDQEVRCSATLMARCAARSITSRVSLIFPLAAVTRDGGPSRASCASRANAA